MYIHVEKQFVHNSRHAGCNNNYCSAELTILIPRPHLFWVVWPGMRLSLLKSGCVTIISRETCTLEGVLGWL